MKDAPAIRTLLAEDVMHLTGFPGSLYASKQYANPGYMTLSLWFRTTTDSGGLLLGFAKVQASADSTLKRDRQKMAGQVLGGISKGSSSKKRLSADMEMPAT
jgi:hypothetical protein